MSHLARLQSTKFRVESVCVKCGEMVFRAAKPLGIEFYFILLYGKLNK